MKLEHIEIGGKLYPLAFSINALSDLEDKFGSLEEFGTLLSDDNAKLSARFSAVAAALEISMESGNVAAAELGGNPPDLPEVSVAALLGLDDMPMATEKIFALLSSSTDRKVEAEPPKNASPTPDTPPDTLPEAAI